MKSGISIGQYYPAQSAIHRLDARIKICLTMGLMVVAFLIQNWAGYGLLAVGVVLAVLVSRVPPLMLLRGLRSVLFLIALTTILNTFFSPQATGRFSWVGLDLGLRMAVRLTLLVFSTSLLTFSTSPIALTDGLESLLLPFARLGLPAHELAMMMSIALRFIPTIIEEAMKIMKAQMARGADFETGNIVRRARAMVPILVPLFLGSFRRADELALAMEARCYRGSEGRTRMVESAITQLDWYATSLVITYCAITLFVGMR